MRIKITEAAASIAMNVFGTTRVTDEQALHSLGIALDEYQRGVEQRLDLLERRVLAIGAKQ